MRIRRDQDGAVSVEQMAWLALTVVALVIMGSVFVPALKNSVVNTVKDTTVKSYSMYSLSCPTGTLPAAVTAPGYSGNDGSGNGKYNITYGAMGVMHGLRPAAHQSSNTFTVNVGSGPTAATYVCVLDNAGSGVPNPQW